MKKLFNFSLLFIAVMFLNACNKEGGCVSFTATASSNSPVAFGGDLMLNVSTSLSSGDYTYEWTGPNGFSSTLQNPTIANVTQDMMGDYNVVITRNGCAATSDDIDVIVNACIPPATPTATSNSPVNAGTNINLSSSTVANATYQWTGPNGFSSTLQNPTIANATEAMGGAYRLVVTVDGCESAADTAFVTLNAPCTPSNNTAVYSSFTTLSFYAIGASASFGQYKITANASGGDLRITFPGESAPQSGVYEVISQVNSLSANKVYVSTVTGSPL